MFVSCFKNRKQTATKKISSFIISSLIMTCVERLVINYFCRAKNANPLYTMSSTSTRPVNRLVNNVCYVLFSGRFYCSLYVHSVFIFFFYSASVAITKYTCIHRPTYIHISDGHMSNDVMCMTRKG